MNNKHVQEGSYGVWTWSGCHWGRCMCSRTAPTPKLSPSHPHFSLSSTPGKYHEISYILLKFSFEIILSSFQVVLLDFVKGHIFALSNNSSEQLAAVMLPSNLKKWERKFLKWWLLNHSRSRSRFIFEGSESEPLEIERLRNSAYLLTIIVEILEWHQDLTDESRNFVTVSALRQTEAGCRSARWIFKCVRQRPISRPPYTSECIL